MFVCWRQGHRQPGPRFQFVGIAETSNKRSYFNNYVHPLLNHCIFLPGKDHVFPNRWTCVAELERTWIHTHAPSRRTPGKRSVIVLSSEFLVHKYMIIHEKRWVSQCFSSHEGIMGCMPAITDPSPTSKIW